MFSAFLSAGAVSPVTGTLPFNPTPPYLPFGFGKPWEIFRQRWYMLADRLDHRIAKPGSLLDGKIRTYGSEWESSDGFLDALAYSFIGKVSEVAATVALRKLHPVEAA